MLFTEFSKNEDGNVAVDFVALTALLIGLSVAVLSSIGGGAVDLGETVGDEVAAREAGTFETTDGS